MTDTATAKPATNRWAAGDKARIRNVFFHDRTWHVGNNSFSAKSITMEPGDIVTLVGRVSGPCGDQWRFTSPKFSGEKVVDEVTIEPITVEAAKNRPVPPPDGHQWAAGDEAIVPAYTTEGEKVVELVRPFSHPTTTWWGRDDEGLMRIYAECDMRRPAHWKGTPDPSVPPATILYRVEYRDNGEYSPAESRKAALVPIAGIAERLRIADILGLLSDDILRDEDEAPDDEFMVVFLGGVAEEPYDAGDPVTILGGIHTGKDFYLVERDQANGQRWWMAEAPGSAGTLGLHVDGFTRKGGGGE